MKKHSKENPIMLKMMNMLAWFLLFTLYFTNCVWIQKVSMETIVAWIMMHCAGPQWRQTAATDNVLLYCTEKRYLSNLKYKNNDNWRTETLDGLCCHLSCCANWTETFSITKPSSREKLYFLISCLYYCSGPESCLFLSSYLHQIKEELWMNSGQIQRVFALAPI